MNSQIVRLYALILLLFVGLVAFTSRWAVFEADELEANVDNNRPLIEEQQIARGTITTSDGVLIAESERAGGGVFVRNYPTGALFGNPVGYSFVEVERTGIELSENDLLSGDQNEFATIIDQLSGTTREGADITLTLDAGAQQVALDALNSAIAATGSVGGSVVALEPDTGAVKVMASVPGFNPNDINDEAAREQLRTNEDAPLLNRATQSTYQPGSTMKVVTAVAALDSGEFETSTTLNADSGIEISGVPLENSGGTNFGTIDMTQALDKLGQHLLGAGRRAARRRHHGRIHEALRVLRRPGTRLPGLPDARERAVQLGGRSRRVRLRRRPCRYRPGRRRGSAARRPDRRWPRLPPQSPTTAS